MSARLRKLIGSALVLIFLGLYVGAAGAIGARLPNQWALQLAYYVIVGTAWGLPIIPLITWMNRGR